MSNLFVTAGALWFASICHSATLVRIQCGGPGGIDAQGNAWQADAYYTGGARWGAANQADSGGLPLPTLPYSTLRYSSGAAFGYVIALPPTTAGYRVVLKFVEPNKSAAGQRVFSVAANGVPVISSLDLFAVAGLLKPWDASFTVAAPDGRISLTFAPSVGNAVVSAIQVDDVSPPPPAVPQLMECDIPYSNGGDLIPVKTYNLWSCWPQVGSWKIVRFRCVADSADPSSNSVDLAILGVPNQAPSILSAPISCTGTDAVILPGAILPTNGYLQAKLKIGANTTQVLATVLFEQR
jgi:Malectin domain